MRDGAEGAEVASAKQKPPALSPRSAVETVAAVTYRVRYRTGNPGNWVQIPAAAHLCHGEVAEWAKGTGLNNQRVPRGFGGSNPPLSALSHLIDEKKRSNLHPSGYSFKGANTTADERGSQ